MSVTVIVVTYNAMKWIEALVSSVGILSDDKHLVFVDNGSRDGTVDYIRGKVRGATLVQSHMNIGFGQANNAGIRLALKRGDDSVFLLNQDAWLKSGALASLLEAQKNHPEFGIISPLQKKPDDSGLDSLFRDFGYESIRARFESDSRNHAAMDLYETPFSNAAAWLVSRACLERTGGFDPIYFMYGEDVDYVARARYFGFKIGICPGAIVYHDRADRPVSDREYMQRLRGSAVYRMKKPTSFFAGRIASVLLAEIVRSGANLVRGRIRRSLLIWPMIGGLVADLPVISRSRRLSRRAGAFL